MEKDKVSEMPDIDDVSGGGSAERNQSWTMPAEAVAGGLEKFRAERFAEMVHDMELHRDGFSAEHLEWIRNDPEICKLSIGRDNSTLLLLAANLDCAQMVEELLATGACDAEALDSDGYSALMLAAMADDEVVGERMARALISQCSMKAPSRTLKGVAFAISCGNLRVAKLLAEACGERAVSAEGPLLTDSWGRNWLHLSLESTSPDEALAWVLSLPSARLMLNTGDEYDKTPWDLALGMENQRPEAIRRLREARACWERDDILRDASIGGSVGRKGAGRL